jgi:UDP-N-acetyl-D-mannosaminuronic acid dehydrogenase
VDYRSRQRAANIYRPFLKGDIYYSDLVSAELCKLIENTFRDINVAVANEFALIGDKLNINIQNVIKMANKHPRVDILDPGIGVGGHCLPVDPWFLNQVNPEHTNLITTARRLNDMMPQVAVQKIRHKISDFINPDILVLGLSYKPNTHDSRNSPAKDVVEMLRADGYSIETYDRYVSKTDLPSLLLEYDPDVILHLIPHDETVREINELSEESIMNGRRLVQFIGQNRFNPKVTDFGSDAS